MNIELGRPLAYGRTAEIYAWRQGQVLKLFYQWFELERIEREAHISQVVFASGLPVPAVGEIILWLPVVAAARMSDNIPELESMLISQVEKYL